MTAEQGGERRGLSEGEHFGAAGNCFAFPEVHKPENYKANSFGESLNFPGQSLSSDLILIQSMVELVGIEPTTSSLRTMRSPS